MSKLHLQGMGVIGSLLALKLHQQGQKFTWSDIDSPINAWKASTGCVYPSGDAVDEWSYNAWAGKYFGDLPEMSAHAYCFLSKHPPHGGKYLFQRKGPFGVASVPSFHLNAQRLVPRVRELFKAQRRNDPLQNDTVIITHGFSRRLGRYLWGWTVKVKLDLCGKLNIYSMPCLYMRVGRFKLAYAYPIPLEPGWYYAGSSLISQHYPRTLDIMPKFERWRKHVFEETGIAVKDIGQVLEGWRPVAAKDDIPLLRKMNGQWVIRPQWSSGIRHAPGIVETLLGKVL